MNFGSEKSQKNSFVTNTDILFVVVVALIEVVSYRRGLPLPGPDLAWYTEPAIYLATEGVVRAPSLVYVDPTFDICWGWYPPGFPLVLGGWVYVFGFYGTSISAYHHLIHALTVFALFALLRTRFRASSFSASLATLMILPWYGSFGRPDLTASLFGQLAWLATFRSASFHRLGIGSALLAFGALTSPIPGGQFALLVAIDQLVEHRKPWKIRCTTVLLLTTMTLLFFSVIWGIFLCSQPNPSLLIQQFTTASLSRGAENRISNITWDSPFILAFFVVPFAVGICGLLMVPLVYRLVIDFRQKRFEEFNEAQSTVFLFLASSGWWWLTSAGPFITGFHYGLVTPAMMAATSLSPRRDKRYTYSALLAISLQLSTLLYFEKGNFVYLFAGIERVKKTDIPIEIDENDTIALDNVLWQKFYRKDRTLNAIWMLWGSGSSKYRVPNQTTEPLAAPKFVLFSEFGYAFYRLNGNSFPGYKLLDEEPCDLLMKNLPRLPEKTRVYVKIQPN